MEVEVDLASIRDEELLRRMWQQSEDFGHKKDIRQHLYKLREARLREFYTIGTDIMDCPPGQGIIKKSPLTPSHGDSLADQSFQSFKSKEIRDSESPTKDMKFAQQQLHSIRDGSICVKPDTSGWNVVTSSELNPDGTGYKTETLATTGGIRKIAGGQAEFAGKNEHMQKASEYGDDKNFVKSAAESSNTHLQESSVVGDEQSGRIEKKSSTTVSSSSKSFVSKSTTGDDGGYVDQYSDFPSNALQNRRDSTQSNMSVNSNMSTQQQQRQLTLQEKLQQTRKNVESRSTTSVREEEHHREQRDRQHQQTRDDVEQQQYTRKQQQDDRIIREQQHQQQQQKTDQKSFVSKEAQRYMTQHTDRDGITYTKSPVINQDSPAELQREFQRLETQPGKIISRTIEYPKPNLKMIVEKKELADGTIITSRNYETEGTPTVIEPQQKVVSGSRKVEEGGSYKISITKGSTDDDQHQFTKNVDQRSRQILRDTDRKLTNTNERNITNRTVTSDERENYDREVQQKRTNVNEDILNQDRINQTRQITRDHQENINKINRIDIRENQERYEREFQDWQNNVSGDTVDKSIVSNIQQTARDHVENLKNQVETFETHKTVKKDLSQTMRKENISSQDYIQTENGCIMVDRNNRGRPEKMMSTPTNQFEDCNQYNETRTTKNETYNKYVDETGNDYHPTGQRPRQQKPEQDFTTHGFPSQRPDTDSKDTYISTEQYQNRTERINKNEDFSTHGFPSVRDPTPKKPFDHSPTQSTGRQPTPDNLTQGRTPKNEKPDYTTHGFPSARVPDEKKVVDHGPVRSPHDKKTDQSFSTHGFPSVRDPTPKTPFDHGPVKSPSSKHPKPDYSTHGVPSVGTPTERKPAGHDYPATKSPHNERPSQDYTTKNGFPAAREPTPSKRTEEVNIVEVKKSNQYQTRSQQKTTEKKTEMYKSTESLRREKKTDAAHDAFARSLRCASPVDMPRRDSNASQKSTSYRTHSIQTSRGSTPTYRAPTATSKLKTRDVHHSNETIDLGSSPHHADDLKRRGPSKITTTTTSTTTRDNSGEIQKKNISKLNRQNKAVAYEPTITKKTIIEDDRFVGADEIIEEPIVKKNYKQLCPDSCPLPKRFDEITEITKNVSPENYGAKRSVKSPSQNYMEPTESQISRVSKNFEENLKVNAKTHEPEYELKKVVFSNRETNKPEEENLPRNKSPIRDSSTPEISHPKRHYLEPTESQISRVNKNIENYVEGNETVSSHRASSPIRKSSPIRETSPNRKTSPIRTHTISNKSVEKTQSSEEHNNQHQNYSKPYTIVGPVPIKPVGYVSKKVSSEITTDFKEIDDNKVTYPGFLKKSKSKSPKDSPAVSPDRTNSRKASPQPNDKTPFTTKNRSNDSPISNRKPSGPIQQKEPYHVPQYDSPKSKPTSVHPQSISPERTTTTRDLIPSSRTTTKTNKFQSTDTREDITNDYENITKPTYPREPHYDSPVSKPSSRYPSSTSPERNTIRDDLTTKTTKTNKVDRTVIREDITNDYEDSSEPSRPREPHYASPISKPSSRHPSSTSPERNTIIRDDLTTKTTKTNKVDRTVIREDITNDYEDSSEPSRPREPHYASPISKPSSRHPSSTSPERNTIRDDLTTKTTKTNKVDRTVIREDITNDYEDSSEPSRPREPHYASPISKPSSRHPSSTTPERNTIIRDDLTTKTTKTNKVDRTVIREDITNDYEDSSEPSRPREPHYASPISKPSSRHPSSTSPERNTIRDDLTTKTIKTNKVDRTVIREDITNDYEDSSEPSRPREPHYASPISKPSSRHPTSTSPERNTIIRDDLTTKTTKTNKVDRTVIREDITNDYEDNSEPSRPREPHYASPISKPSSRHPSSTSPERNTIIRDDLTSKTTKTNKVDRTVIREDITNDYEDSSEPSRPREPHYASPTSTPSSKHPSSTSPDRNTIRDDLTTKTTKTNKMDRTVIREDITNDYEDSSEPSRPREPHYTSPISKPSSRHPSSTSPERTIIRDDLTTKTTKTNKVDKTVIREDITTDYEDSSEPSRPREPHYASPISKPSSRHPSSTSPERNTIIRDDLTTKTTKTNKVDRTVIREDITNDYEDSSEPSRPREPHYASPISKPSSRHPLSTSPERNTIRDDLTTKTTKTNKVDRTVIREDITNDYQDSSEPSRPREPHYASPISKPSSRHPSSTSPERNTIIRDDLTTKTIKTNKVDRTVIREDITNDYEDSSEPSRPREPHYVSPISKPSSRHPSSTSPERNTIRDDLTTKTTKTNKVDRTVIREDITNDYEDSSEPSRPREPHYASPISKPSSRHPSSTSPERNTIRDDLTTKTTKTNKVDRTVIREDITNDYEDSSEATHHRQPHYASPISKPSSRYPSSTSPERTTTIRDDLTTTTIKTNKLDSTVTRDDTTHKYEDSLGPSCPRKPHHATPKSKPTSGYPQSTSPERTTILKDDSTKKTSRTNKYESTLTQEDNTDDFEETTDLQKPRQPHKNTPSAKYPKSISPDRTTITRDDLTTETNKFECTVTREHNLYGHDDNSRPHYPLDGKLQPNIPKSKDIPKSSSPERKTSSKKDSTTEFTKIKTNSILRDSTKKPSKTSDDEGMEPESPRSNSPTSDFEYRRNTEIKSKVFTTDLDSENIYIRRDSNKIRDEAFNTEFITKERENVYRETSPVHDKYRPRSTTQEYFEQTEKIENMRYPSSKSPEDNKPKEPFFLRENSPYEEEGSRKPDESPKPKTKAPFNRRETFDERCRQVLGINETNEINESTSVTMKHKNTSQFIDNEKNVEDIRKLRKSSTPSPVPSPRSASPKKIIPKQDHVNKTINTYDKFIKHEKELFTEKDTETTRSVSPGRSPTRKISPQRSKPTATIKDVSYLTNTKTTRQQGYSPKDTPTGSPYTRSPASSPVRRPKSPDHISKITARTVPRDQSPETQTHITIAKIKISPSTPKSYVPETNLMKPQKPKSSPVITTTTSTTTGNRNTTKSTKSSPDNNRPNYITQSKKNVPLIHKKSDSELDKESDIVSDDEDVITTTTTKITKTTNKKNTPNKKLPVTERKESAPVYRSTQIDRDQKMTRSTSDNILKTQKRTKLFESDKLQNNASVGPKSPRKTSLENKKDLKTERRPSKCLTTKTINLSTKTNIINSEDMENVIIDIQQAKSSREPSPNKMVPIPVPLNEDTGKPRYPDKVQEPEEHHRRTKIKNVPIYEEAKDDFVGCHISEVRETDEEFLRSKHLSRKLFNDEKTTMKSSIEIDSNTNYDEDCLLSVHDKVSKFINTAEEVTKPKSSVPFQRDVPQMNFSEDDDCLLSVNDKVNKFLTTAEKVTKDIITSTGKRIETVNLDEIDKNLREDECILSVSQKVNKFINTAEKLVETQPQKSPELVAKIEKQISRQSDDDRNEEECINTKTTKVKSRITERYTPDKPKREPLKTSTKPVIKTTDAVRKAKSVFEKNELKDVKLSKTTATTKQRDIISRPSVWETKKQETIENRKNIKNRDDTEYIKTNTTTKPVSLIRNLDIYPSDSFGNTVITSKTELSAKAEDVTARLTRKTTPRRPSDTPTSRYPGKKTPTVGTKTEYIDEYTNKFGKSRPKDYSPNTSPDRGTSSRKHPVESKTEYTDEYTDKYGYTEKNISKKNSSSSITSKRIDQRYPEQSPTRVSRKPTESLKSPSDNKPETYSPSWSRNKQPKQSSPTRTDSNSPTRLTSSYVEENTYSSYTTNRDNSPTRPSSTHYNKRPDDHSPARSINHYTEEQKSYRTSTRQNGTPSPSISDRKYLFENIDPSAPRPSYMDHTKASLEHIRRDSLEVNRTSYNRRLSVDEESFDGNPRSAVKFGVDLKHHDESKPRRKSSSPEIPHIEEIFELDLLEQMLSVVVGYEQRRRIRSQIRIVKKMIEQKAKEEAQIAYIRETSPARRSGSSERENSISSITRKNIRNKTEDEQVAYIRETSPVRRSSPTRSVTSSSSQKKNIRTKSNSSFIENESKHIEKHEKIRERSPQSKTKTVTTIRETRKVDEKPKNKTKPVALKDSKSDEKPIWATKNILKKPSEHNYSPKTSTTKKIHTSTTKTTQSQRQKISSDEDCITSSYGIGPTDEDGRPLFGIRALKKKQQPSETSKVTGTMITENYYSENGSAPLGERTVTVYSSNPNDIDEYESKFDNTKRSGSIKRESSKQNGLTSVTRTQKFGDDYPIHDTEYHALRDDSTSTNSKSSKVNRKSSVKEMSEKFIRKESSSSVTEKKTSSSSTSYPKAGLILHTKTTNRQSNPTEHDNTDDYDYEYDNSTRHSQLINESESDSESCKITRTINKSSKSFLNTTGSKVTGVDDVLERMRNADNVIEDGDTVEDHEARALLNKFLGATVLMSGVESMVPKAVVTTRTIKVEGSGPRSTQEVKTTRVTKNIKTEGSSSSPVAQQTCDIEEIWDIEFLKELLEQSTSYEERSTIRARIKQLMAEREACAEIVASVNAELQSPNAKKQSSKVETTTKKIVTTTTTTAEKEEEEEVSDDGEEGEEEEEEEVEVDDDSSSEYEEIIVEVTDSEDDEIEFKESLNVVKNTQPNPNDKKIIGKTIIQSQTNVTTEQQVKKQLPCDSKQIKVTTNKTDNSNKDNIEGKIIKNIDEDLSESSDSLLLPLLQGLLHKNMPTITHNQTTKTTNPKITNNTNNSSSSSSNNNRKNNNVNSNNNDDINKQVNNTKKTIQIMNTQSQQKNQTNTNKSIASLTNNNKKNNTGHHHIEDSGTESGEDLRLIAAGLRDTMQMHSIKDPSDTGLISEVTTALNRLEQSLKEGKHIKLENSKRNALLNLVARLQTGLISPDKIPPPTPAPDQTGEMETSSPEADNHRGGNRQRFAKRRSRANRHTVGVSREELADARRYMEEMVMIENMSNCTTPESSAVTPSDLVPQPVKNEESSVIKPTVNSVNQQQQQSNSSTLYRPNQFVPNNLKDTTAGGSHEEYIPDKPGVQMRGKKPKYEPNQRLSGNLDQQGPVIVSRRPLSDSYTAAFGQQIPNQTYQNVAQPHFNEIVNHQQPQFTDHKKQPTYENNPYTAQQSTNSSQYGSAFNAANLIEQHYDGIYECVSPNNVPLNRFSNKKLAMKRANTIDIPKPMKYLHDMESDSDAEERGVSSTKSIGLRGTVQVSVKTKPRQVLPAFQPKTENDIKFLQFIQKQGSSTGLGWNNPNRTVSNWTNKFGNIKNSFESGATSTTSKPPVPASAAKNFWKKNDSQQNVGGKTLVSKVSNTPKTLSRPPWADQNYSSNVLTSALKTKERNEYPTTFHGHSTSFDQQYSPMQPQQQEYAQLSQHETMQQQHPQMRQQQSPIQRQYMQSPQNHIPQQQIIKPKPISLNNFSHAPQSVFKPVDPVTPEYPERFKPIHTDSRLHQSEPHLNFQSNTQMYHDQIIQQEQTNKPWSLVGKYSAPSSPHHSIPSPTKSWFTTKNSTPSSPVTSTLPWLSKNKVDNRIRTKAEKFDKRSPPPVNLQRHNSLRGKDQDYQNRMSSYDLDKVDLKRPSLPNTTEPYVNGVYQSQPFYGSNPKINHGRQEPQYQPTDCQYQQMAPVTKYQQSPIVAQYQQSAPVGQYNPLPPSYNSAENIQQASQKLDNRTQYRQPSTQYKSVPSPTYQTIPYTSTDYSEPAISTFVQSRTREQSLTNPNAEPLVLTSTKPSFGPTVPLKIFDYPSPSCSISSPNFTQNDATDDDLDPESMTEYKTETRVMTGPVSQQAVTVGNKTRHVGNEEKHTSGAKDLLSVMKNLGNATISKDKKSSNVCLSPDGRTYQAPLVEPIFPEVVVSDQNRMPAYIESNPLPYQPQNAQPFSKYQTQTSSSGLSPINGSNPEMTRQTQYQQNPTYVPIVQQTQTSAMYTGYPPGYRLPPEANTEFDFKSNQSYQPVPELNDVHNMHQQQIQNYQSVDLRQNQSYEQPRVQNFEPLIESHQLPNHNNQYQYPDVQKNLNQHREVHDNYPKQFDFQTQQHEHQKQEQQYQESIEKSRKKSMPKVDFKDAPRSVYISENPPKQNVQPKVTYQDLKPVKRQDTTTSIKIDPHQAYLKPTEIDPQSPKFYVDAQPTHQIVKKPESKLINKETTHRQLQNSVEESRHQKTVQQSKLYKTEQKSKVIYEQSKKQVKSTNKVEQKQQKQQHSEVSTKVHTQQKVFQENKTNIKTLSETEKRSTSRKVVSEASQEIIEKGEYKSSAPTDTPDIVKSSLPKDENFPILKKFGPPQRHLYTPNAYKSPLGRSDSNTDVKPAGPIMTRKFSDPTIMAKFSAPEIIETPSTPMPADSKDDIPRNIVFNNVAQFSNMSRRISDTSETYQKFPVPNTRPNLLSKSDSWTKICQQQTSAKPPSPKFNQSGEFGGHGLRRAKSGHTLALPKMYEAGIKREEVTEKQKTVAAYFSGNKSPNSLSRNSSQTNLTESISTNDTSISTTKRTSINRIKTSAKASVNKQYPSTGLCRSATMPHILNLLDEKSTRSETTETKNEDGSVVTTTTKVTTRTVSSGSTTVPKQVSPFAKFKQLDKQNSITSQNSPKTPITPSGTNRGAPIFAFTDPTVAARAATAKEQLLHWCQMKTKEYENIQITNFSTSWNDGMAFCALIHHFLPDAFDFTKLTPKQRRYNFTLAFRVADEKAGIAPLLDVEDMVVMKRPDWKCVFTYVQSIHRHFRNCQ